MVGALNTFNVPLELPEALQQLWEKPGDTREVVRSSWVFFVLRSCTACPGDHLHV